MYITTGTSTLLRRASSHASSSSSTASAAGKRLFKSLSNNPNSNLDHSGGKFGSGVSQYCRSFRSVPRWSHGYWKSPMSLTSQIRTTSVADSSTLLHRKIATMASENAFKGIFTCLKPGGGEFGKYYSLPALNDPRIDKLPYSIRILLESAICNCDGFQVTKEDVEKIIDLENTSPKLVEIPFKPARVLLQDFTGVPAVVDLACMRDATNKIGSDSNKINPLLLIPISLVACGFLLILLLITLFKLMLPGQKMLFKQIWSLKFRETRRVLLYLSGDLLLSTICLLFHQVLVSCTMYYSIYIIALRSKLFDFIQISYIIFPSTSHLYNHFILCKKGF